MFHRSNIGSIVSRASISLLVFNMGLDKWAYTSTGLYKEAHASIGLPIGLLYFYLKNYFYDIIIINMLQYA